MPILVLIGVYLVFKVTTSYEKLHQDNGRSTERYVILWDVVKHYKILEIVVISTASVSLSERYGNKSSEYNYSGLFLLFKKNHHFDGLMEAGGVCYEKKLFVTPEFTTAKEVKRIRTMLGLTQKEFAMRINCSKVTVERWETTDEPIQGNIIG